MIINVNRRTVAQMLGICQDDTFRLSVERVSNYGNNSQQLVIIKVEGDVLLESGINLEKLSEKDLISLLLEV